MEEKLTLDEKVALARKEFGFNKGVKWVKFLRIIYPLWVWAIFGLPGYGIYLTQTITPIMIICWLAMICIMIMYGYGLYTFRKSGYHKILCYWITIPILYIIFEQAVYYNYTGALYIDTYTGIYALVNIVYAILNILYFYNRKVLFYCGTSFVDAEQTEQEIAEYGPNVVTFSDYKKQAETPSEQDNSETISIQDTEPHTQIDHVANNSVQENTISENTGTPPYFIGCITLAIIALILFVVAGYFYSELKTVKAERDKYSKENWELNMNNGLLKAKIESLEYKPDPTKVVAYIDYYHKHDCFLLEGTMGKSHVTDAETAKSQGYLPCNFCNP